MALLSSLQDARRGVRLSCDPIDHPTAGYIDRNHLNYGVRTDSPGVYLPSWLTAFLLGVGALSLLAGSLEAAELITCGEAAGCAVIVLWWVIDVIEAWLPQQLAAVAAAASSAAAGGGGGRGPGPVGPPHGMLGRALSAAAAAAAAAAADADADTDAAAGTDAAYAAADAATDLSAAPLPVAFFGQARIWLSLELGLAVFALARGVPVTSHPLSPYPNPNPNPNPNP